MGKEAYDGINALYSEIDWAWSLKDPKHLKVVKKHLVGLQERLTEAEQTIKQAKADG